MNISFPRMHGMTCAVREINIYWAIFRKNSFRFSWWIHQDHESTTFSSINWLFLKIFSLENFSYPTKISFSVSSYLSWTFSEPLNFTIFRQWKSLNQNCIITILNASQKQRSLHRSQHPLGRLRLTSKVMPINHKPRSRFPSHRHHGRLCLKSLSHFVPNLTIGPPVVKWLRTHLPAVHFDCHMNVTHPRQYIDQLAKIGINCFTFHYESDHGDIN